MLSGAMGKHPEIDLNEIVQIEEYSDIVEEFVKFCEDNPVWKMDNANDFKNNIQNWATALKNGTDRIKELKMPDINYSDKDELDGNTKGCFCLNCEACPLISHRKKIKSLLLVQDLRAKASPRISLEQKIIVICWSFGMEFRI